MSEQTSAFVDGELGGMRWLQFRLHLMMCRHCPNFVEQIRRTRSLVHSALVAGRAAAADVTLISAFRAGHAAAPCPHAHREGRDPFSPGNGG